MSDDELVLAAVLPADVDGHVAHGVLEALSTRWPSLTLRGRADGSIEVRVDVRPVRVPRKVV